MNKLRDIVKYEDIYKAPRQGGHLSTYYDKVFGGAIKGQAVLYVAPSGGGKTRQCVDITYKLLSAGWSVAYLTLEQTTAQIVEMLLARMQGSTEQVVEDSDTWARAQDLPLYVSRFNMDTETTLKQKVERLKEYNAVVIDYLVSPDNCSPDGAETSVVLRRIIAGLKKLCEDNNQFLWICAQGRDGYYVNPSDAMPKFSDVEDLWGSKQMINPVETVIVAKTTHLDGVMVADVIKNRYPRGVARCRIVRDANFAVCAFNDTELQNVNGGRIDDCI